MASLKIRSRKDGAAVAMDDTDRGLLNLLQGSFPLDPRPYAKVAAAIELTEAEVVQRVDRLVKERIIRQVTPIFDTRALGYASMLVAAKVDPENPWRPAKVVNAHPGVSHNYLRNHEFNLWFTIATEPDSELGLEGTLQALAAEAGAESVRQLPTLKLFKIRMDLEMVKGTEALRHRRRGHRARRDRAPALRRDRHRGHPRHAGRHADRRRALRAGRGRSSAGTCPSCSSHLEGMRERRLLRRVAAILFHRRAGFSANGMGVWKVPDDKILELGARMASFRGISHCYQRPTYADWPYSVFTMAHGRSKEECDAILDAIAEDTGIHERSTLYSSTEFKKIRLQYFTDEFKAWERAHS